MSEVVREHRPDESGKRTVTPSKASEAGGGRNRALELNIIGRSAFCGGQNSRSIVIVAPLRFSKFSRVLKNSTHRSRDGPFTYLVADLPVRRLADLILDRVITRRSILSSPKRTLFFLSITASPLVLSPSI
jgi:hypothetical protein